MKLKSLTASLLFLFFLILASPALAADSLDVVINEMAWMGTENSYNDEWIELYNNPSDSINLEGWKLVAEDGTPEINLTGGIPGQGFFLLERTDDETVPDVEADLIYKGSLNNKGEYLKLIDDRGKIIDEIDCSSGWFAGDNTFKKTMERKNPLLSGSDSSNWQTSQEPGGTPRAENSQVSSQPLKEIVQEAEPTAEAPAAGETTFSEPEPTVYPSNVFINEILPSPEGADAENEWIEIFNGNNFEVDVSDWQIRDTVGVTKTYTIPGGTKIDSNGFLVLPRPETKITLQNSGDKLELLNPVGEIVHQINYEKASLGQSFNRTLSGWSWSTTLTRGKENVISLPEPTETKETSSKKLETENQKTEENQKSSLEKITLAQIGEKSSEPLNNLFGFFIAVIIAISSGVIVLILRKKISSQEE